MRLELLLLLTVTVVLSLSLGALYLILLATQKREKEREQVFLSRENHYQVLMESQEERHQLQLQNLIREKTQLFNRMMASDLPAFATMTALNESSVISEGQYVSPSDQAEAARYAEMVGASVGLGDEIHQQVDDDASGILEDMGLAFNKD